MKPKFLKSLSLGLVTLCTIAPIIASSTFNNYVPITTSINNEDVSLDSVNSLVNQSKYDGRELGYTTPVKYQNSNICWAYSSAAAIESNILKNKLIPGISNSTFGINEKNIDYITNWRFEDADPLELTSDDIINKYLNNVGYTFNAVNALMQWNGPIESTQAPYTLHNPLLLTKNIFYMQDYNLGNETEPEALIQKIKEAIIQYGAIGFEYGVYYDITNVKYYNAIGSNAGTIGHASTIVGWDNSIDKNLYKPASKYDGGWIVKNSYGSSSNDNGYFYMSYDSVMRGLCAFEMVNKSTYQNNYYYDGLNYTHYVVSSSQIYKNKELGVIFPVKKASESTIEKLSGVNVGIKGKNVTVKVKVYTGVNADLSNRTSEVNDPSSGTLKAEVIKTFSNAGLYTIDLENPITLNKGENFGIVVSITSDDSDAAVLLSNEPNSTNDMTYRKEEDKWISTSINSGDYSKQNLVPRIKAFTTTETISTPEPTPPTTPEQPKPPISTPEEPEIPPTTEPEEPTNPSPSPDDEEIKSDVVISKQPETSQEVQTNKNEGIDLAIEAKSNQGKQLKYQWYENKGDGWKSIKGATNSTYNIPSTELQSVKTETTWQYRAEIQYNDGTNAKLTSQTYNVKVKPTTTINPSDDAIADDTTTKTSRYLSIPAIVGIAVGGVSVATIIGSSIYFIRKKKK